MSYGATPPPMPGFSPAPPPPPPSKNAKTHTVVIASAAAAVAAVVAAAVTVGVTGDGEAEAAPTVTVTTTETVEGADTAADTGSEEPADEESSADSYGLGDTVAYENDVEVSLSKFSRSVSSDYASPGNTPYAKFTIKVVNDSSETVDATEMTVNCAYGDEGREGEAIFDEGLDGLPDTRVLAGRSLSVTWGCELPKNEKYLQVEVAPDFESEAAIFAGDVK
ncbi:hypothetical protein GCM10010266_17390 [Streptomyces griseomycini]|nr:hypothetical protein GCM10010266_17390 [Streptomyces griseomycini]